MKVWKVLFWIVLTLLILTNLFWFYQVVDTAIGHSYYKVSCEEYEANSKILETTLKTFKKKRELIIFLEKHKIKFETINKAYNENYIIIGSIAIQYKDNGDIVSEN